MMCLFFGAMVSIATSASWHLEDCSTGILLTTSGPENDAISVPSDDDGVSSSSSLSEEDWGEEDRNLEPTQEARSSCVFHI